jgi:hypothetical protein
MEMEIIDELCRYIHFVIDSIQQHKFDSATGLTAWEKGRISAYEDILNYLESSYGDEI